MKTIIPRNMLPVMAPSSFNDQDLSITTSVIPVKSKNDAVSNMDRGRFDSRSISLPQRPIPAVIAVDNPATMNIGPIIFWVIVFQPTSAFTFAPLVARTGGTPSWIPFSLAVPGFALRNRGRTVDALSIYGVEGPLNVR